MMVLQGLRFRVQGLGWGLRVAGSMRTGMKLSLGSSTVLVQSLGVRVYSRSQKVGTWL